MKTLFMKHKWMQLVYGLLLLAAGVVIIALALSQKEEDFLSKALSVVVAITVFIYAAALLFTGIFSLKDRYFDLAFLYAVFFIAIGVVLLCSPEMIGKFITVFVATLLTAIGAIEIGEATAMVFFKRPVVSIVIFYLLGAILITLGILAFAFPTEVKQIIYVGVGGIFCIAALFEIALGVISLFKKEKSDDVLDANVEEKKETEPAQVEEKKDEPVNPEIINPNPNGDNDGSDPQA